jgi:hypothetical protein
VLAIVEDALASMPKDQEGNPQDPIEKYWLEATRIEAMLGLADSRCDEEREKLFATAPEPWMNATTESQLKKLAGLLTSTPSETPTAGV